MTRDQARGAYDHVVGSVLDQDRDAPLRLALEKEGVSNIMHLLIMPEATIDAMTYDITGDGTQAANADIPLQNVHKWTLKAFQSYAQYRSDVEEVDNGNLDEWRAINQGEFHNFQCNIFPSLGYTSTRIHSTPTGWPGTTCSPLSPIAEWKKGVERDMALYLEPQQDMEWDRWNTQLRATANTQEVDRVLDPNFHPRDAEDRALFEAEDADFPSESTEGSGHRVGIANHVGHEMTYKILTDDTSKVIYRSSLQTALSTTDHSKHVDLLDGEELTPVLKSPDGEHSQAKPLPVFDSSDLLGQTFLVKHKGEGEPATAKIIKEITDGDSRLADQPECKRFLASVYDDGFQEVVTHNEILDHITQQEETKEPTDLWRFQHTSGHQGLLKSTDKDYNGSPYNVQVEWVNGETTYEPLSIIAADDPVSCGIYAREKGLLNTPGWRRFKILAKRDQRHIQMANKAKLKSYSRMPKFKFGYQVPHDHAEAMFLDQKNGNNKGAEAEAQEMKSFQEFGVFKDLGKGGKPPEGYKKVKLIAVYDVKHDRWHKTRIVASGHLTDIPTESVYSGVVSLRGIRLLVFLAELNGLQAWATDISSAYLQARTKEKLYLIAGPEFGDLEGHTLLVYKALYGLHTSGVRWHERLADCLRGMGFNPCKGEPDIWMRDKGQHWEYIRMYGDDLAIASKDPLALTGSLETKYGISLKGTGPITYHLGCDFLRDGSGVLCIQPKKYIKKMVTTYERLFGTKPKDVYTSPLEKGDHPEMDTSELLDSTGIQQYQSMVGAMQWAVSIGRLDITTAVMTLSSFRVAPRKGHLE